uniref:Uncharacterized protein n=1 Tax=Globisporangium ultimum (strain ATCC 200006 / CBS 805.95 / DAOM BR144) TaxID=431595 RepID=K3WED8_GLOUD
MENIPEMGSNSNGWTSASPAKMLAQAGSFSTSTRKMPQSSTRSLMTPPPSRSGRLTPVQLEMSITEQIARKALKSAVLDDKNALMVLAIPDYDDYKVMQPYSCRSLTNKSKFVGGKDFITRHNPQEVSEFKKQYSRDVGNLNRQRSILAPPTTPLLPGASFGSSSSLAFFASQSLNSLSTSQLSTGSNEIWRKAFTTGQKPCWVLTEFGIETLIGPEYRITTRVPMLPAISAETNTPRSPLRPEAPLLSFSTRETARIGHGVNLLDDVQLASLARTAEYSLKSRPASPPRFPYHAPPPAGVPSGSLTERSPPKVHHLGSSTLPNRPATDDGIFRPASPSQVGMSRVMGSPQMSPCKDRTQAYNDPPSRYSAVDTAFISPTKQPFAMEISPPRVSLGTLHRGEVYLFPLRVRNVGFRQERFRVKHVSATCAGFDAVIAEAGYDKEAARLAPGLASIITVTLCFQHPGKIYGRVQVDTEGIGCCEVEIKGTVR